MSGPEVIKNAADNPNENLSPEKLKELAVHKDKAKEQLKDHTIDQLEAMKTDLATERNEDRNELTPNEQASLDEIVRQIDELIAEKSPAAPPPAPMEVADIVEPKAPEEKTFFDNVKDFFKGSSIVGSMIKGWINLQRTLNGFMGGGDSAKIQRLDALYGKFFGGQEVRDTLTKHFKEKGIAMTIEEGHGDGAAYAELKILHQEKIREKAKGILPALDDPSTAPETKQAALDAAAQAVTFESVMTEKADAYLQTYGAEAQNPNAKTTISGIVQGGIPKIET